MKKTGFTLAEVLITLAIIGVVATLTLPSLMTNTAEQQAVTAFRKALNTLNEAGQMNAALEGFDYGQITTFEVSTVNGPGLDENGVPNKSLWSLLTSRAQVDLAASARGSIKGQCQSGNYGSTSQIFFRDGTVLCYDKSALPNGFTTGVIKGWVDTNGIKSPNLASQCDDELCSKDKRKINDQFPVTLFGSIAIPGHATITTGGVATVSQTKENYAASWAMRK